MYLSLGGEIIIKLSTQTVPIHPDFLTTTTFFERTKRAVAKVVSNSNNNDTLIVIFSFTNKDQEQFNSNTPRVGCLTEFFALEESPLQKKICSLELGDPAGRG